MSNNSVATTETKNASIADFARRNGPALAGYVKAHYARRCETTEHVGALWYAEHINEVTRVPLAGRLVMDEHGHLEFEAIRYAKKLATLRIPLNTLTNIRWSGILCR